MGQYTVDVQYMMHGAVIQGLRLRNRRQPLLAPRIILSFELNGRKDDSAEIMFYILAKII